MIGNFGDFVVYLMTVGCCTKVATSSANDEQNIAYPSKWKGGESLDIILGNRKKVCFSSIMRKISISVMMSDEEVRELWSETWSQA